MDAFRGSAGASRGLRVMGLLLAAAMAPGGARGGEMEVLGARSSWRYHASWRRPATVRDGKYDLGGGYPIPNPGTRWILSSFTEPTPPPQAGWQAADFDDSAWARQTGQLFGGSGHGYAAEVCLLCARTRFGVTDPARAGPLKLKLVYRGGAIVYLNGTEVARGDMPAGAVEPLTLARDYASEAFVGPDGKFLPPPPERGQPNAALAKRYAMRFRRLSAELPARLLRKGSNVLAVELHRAAVPAELGGAGGTGWNPTISRDLWGTCGLESISLTAPPGGGLLANTGTVAGVHVWNLDTMARAGADYTCGCPFEPLRAVRLGAPRRGVSSGQVVVSSDGPLDEISAAMGDLAGPPGAKLAAASVQVRYATADGQVPNLLDRPAKGAAIVPIWLTAHVPADAAAGVYRGTLSIRGLARPATVPVEVTVYDWLLPELRDYHTSVSLLHSPESVARHYKVPLWSEAHMKLLARSMALAGYAGNTLLSVAAIGQDVLGDQPLVVFRKDAGRYVPDFRFARAYLALYARQAPAPRQLSVQVWNYSVSRRGFGRDGGTSKWMCETIKVRLLEGDRLVPAEMPVYTRPGTEATWSAVAAGVKQIVKELGWSNTRLLWGTGGDCLPNDEIVAFFKKIAPDMYWRVVTHGSSVSRWGQSPEERTQKGGLVLGYANQVRRNVTRRVMVDDCPLDVLKRDGVTSAPVDYLSMAPLGRIAAGFSGCGFLSFDTWPWTGADGKWRGPIRSYVPFGNIHPSGPPFVAPGPDGAAASPQLEAFREGLQITEAVLRLRELTDPRRDAEAKAAAQALMDVLESNRRIRPAGTADLRPIIARIYQLVAEAGRAR